MTYQLRSQVRAERHRYLVDSTVQELILQLGFTADLGLTFLVIVIWHSPVTVQCDANLAFLMRFEVLAVDLHSIGMCKDHVAPNTVIICKNGYVSCQLYNAKHKWTSARDRFTHIQGSVEESPSRERVRSLERPGAKTPRP